MIIKTEIPFGVANKHGYVYSAEDFIQDSTEDKYSPFSFDIIQKRVEEGTLVGELGHPESFETSMKNVTHKITDVHVNLDSCIVTCKMLDTPAGRNLVELMNISGHDLILAPRIMRGKLLSFDLMPRPHLWNDTSDIEARVRQEENENTQEVHFSDL